MSHENMRSSALLCASAAAETPEIGSFPMNGKMNSKEWWPEFTPQNMTALIIHARDASNICMHILYKKSDEWPKNLNDYQIFVPLCKSAIFNFCWLVQFSGTPISKIAIVVTDCC